MVQVFLDDCFLSFEYASNYSFEDLSFSAIQKNMSLLIEICVYLLGASVLQSFEKALKFSFEEYHIWHQWANSLICAGQVGDYNLTHCIRKPTTRVSEQVLHRPVFTVTEAKALKFCFEEKGGLYYVYSENKGTDQLCSSCTADLQLCFCLCMLFVSYMGAHLNIFIKNRLYFCY